MLLLRSRNILNLYSYNQTFVLNWEVYNYRLIQENSPTIGEDLSKMRLGEHNALIYDDINSMREIYCLHSKKRLQLRNNTIIFLYHYETKRSIRDALKEFDIDVDQHEADRSLIIKDANEIILRPTLDSFCNTSKLSNGLL